MLVHVCVSGWVAACLGARVGIQLVLLHLCLCSFNGAVFVSAQFVLVHVYVSGWVVAYLGTRVGIQFIPVSWHTPGFTRFKELLCVLQVSVPDAKCPAVFKAKKW
jgi:hypothetical protein